MANNCAKAPAKRRAQRQALVVEALGRGPNWPWPSTPPPWATGLPSSVHRGCAMGLGPLRHRGLENRVVALAAAPARHRAGDHDGHCPGRPGAVCPLAVSGHCPGGGTPCWPSRGTVGRHYPASAPCRARGRETGWRVCWPVGNPQADRWLLMTLAPRRQQRGLVWLEGLDRAGLQADQTRRLAVATHPHDPPGRAARLWLAVAVATLWLVSVGGAAEDTIACNTVLDVTELVGVQRRQRQATRVRLVSVFRRGWSTIPCSGRPLDGAVDPRAVARAARPGGRGSRPCILKNLPL